MAPSDIPGIKELALKLTSAGPHKTLATPRRIRVLFDGTYIYDTQRAKLVWEHPYHPWYYVPKSELKIAHKVTEDITDANGKKIGEFWEAASTKAGSDRKLDRVVAYSDDLDGPAKELAGFVRIVWDSVDRWFEEDQPIFAHPKDPYARVDIFPSQRAIRISVGGKVVAETQHAMHLYETYLPVRYYMPLSAIDASVLKPSSTTTQCPYKGESNYYSVVVDGKEHKDVVWYYTTPTLECLPITGLCCFYDEKVDVEIVQDGKWTKLDRPVTMFS